MRGPLRLALAGLAAAALAVLAGCAHRPPAGGAEDALRIAYGRGRAHRAALLHALDADAVVRVDGRATGRLPAVTASLKLSAPDRVRLFATALPGVSLDLLLAGDSVWAWVPSRRIAVAAAQESLGIAEPAALVARVLGATWDPPAAAWADAARDTSGARVAWREGADSLLLVVDRDARPRAAWLWRAGHGVSVRYDGWTRVDGEPFPERAELTDDTGWARVRITLDAARALGAPGRDWFAPRRNAGEPLGWDAVRELLGRAGTP